MKAADATAGAHSRVALFPLRLVLFPGGLLPLRIFEPRYLRMVGECLRDERPFAVAAIVDGPEAGGVALTARVGALARIIDWEQGDDGLLHLLCEGADRVALGAVDVEHDRLLRADASPLPFGPPHALPDELAWTAGLLAELLQRLGAPFDRLARAPPDADHVANRLVELLPLPLERKQALFETDDAVVRLRRLAGMIDPHGQGVSLA